MTTQTQDELQVESLRSQLLEAIAYVAEDRYSAGWMPGLSQAFHEEGGIWEILGRAVGWPVGEEGQWVWMTWDEATVHYQTAHLRVREDPATAAAGYVLPDADR